MDVFYQTGFWVLATAMLAAAGTYGLYYRKINDRMGEMLTEKRHEQLCELREVPIRQEIQYLKNGQLRIEKDVRETKKVVNQILRVVNGGTDG